MPNIDEILKDVGFVYWTDKEQSALSQMMYNFANKRANHDVVGKTGRVLTTFIKILDTHLPEKEE